jgi:hypothetical protein
MTMATVGTERPIQRPSLPRYRVQNLTPADPPKAGALPAGRDLACGGGRSDPGSDVRRQSPTMMFYLIASTLILLGLVLLWKLSHRNGGTKKKARSAPARLTRRRKGANDQHRSPYHAVSIDHHALNACAAVRALNGRVFLSDAAPGLPVEGCTVITCRCRYQHHEDRRRDDRRRYHHIEEGYLASMQLSDRRILPDRRREPNLSTS